MARTWAAWAFLLLAVTGMAEAATRPKRFEIWDLAINAPVADLPDEFIDYACGTGGGTPGLTLKGFGDFRRCKPEDGGLREVYFRYDDELEYWARANDMRGEMEQFAGTRTYGFPVVTSILIDEGAIMRGIRIASDPRFDTNRDEAYFLKNFLSARLGRDGWDCRDLAAEEGETPVDGVFVKQQCRKDIGEGKLATMFAKHLRKTGQARFDPRTGRQTTNQFESIVRFELIQR